MKSFPLTGYRTMFAAWILIAGCWVLAAGCCFFDIGFWLMLASCWLALAGCCFVRERHNSAN